jgi:hypothetical protein
MMSKTDKMKKQAGLRNVVTVEGRCRSKETEQSIIVKRKRGSHEGKELKTL